MSLRSRNSALLLDDDDMSDDGLDLTEIDYDLLQGRRVPSDFYKALQVLLAISAFADFSAAIAHNFVTDSDERDDGAYEQWDQWVDSLHRSRVFTHWMTWLESKGMVLGFVFAFFWFVDAFFTASRQRERALLKKDRLDLMRRSEVLKVPISSKRIAFREWWNGAHGVYVAAIILQMLTLPVGFYIFLFKKYRRLRGFVVDDEEHLEIVFDLEDDGEPALYESYGIHANLCLGFAIIKHLFLVILKLTHAHVRQRIRRRGRQLVRVVIVRALRNPFRFKHRLTRTLSVIRWIKYIGPLFGTSNKLRDNATTLLKRYRQRREARIARRIRNHMWKELSDEELRDYSARLIQKTFRAYQCRKKLDALKLFQLNSEHFAAKRLQKKLMAMLRRGQKRLRLKEEELRLLRDKQMRIRRKKKELSEAERFRMYTLRNELNTETTRLINGKLLLRPNTTFAVAWRLIFVVAVIFEITQLALNPILAKHKDVNGDPLCVISYVEQQLVPTPLGQLVECVPVVEKKKGPIGRSLQFLSKKKPELQAPQIFPWYCDSLLYSQGQRVIGIFVRLVIEYFLDLMGLICFLDVFISFFVGEYDDQTGSLGPKPFVKRWIIPGILLQLLVNPRMGTISDVLWFSLTGVLRHGPLRVFRWTVAFFYPASIVTGRVLRRARLEHSAMTND